MTDYPKYPDLLKNSNGDPREYQRQYEEWRDYIDKLEQEKEQP